MIHIFSIQMTSNYIILNIYCSVWPCLFGSAPEAFQEGKERGGTYVVEGFIRARKVIRRVNTEEV